MEDCFVTKTVYSLQSIFLLMVSDAAAVGVSSEAGMEERETCYMHDGDKLGNSATGRLAQYWGGVELYPFPAGISLMKTAHKVRTFLI